VDFGNLSYEERDRVWGFKPLREVLAQAIGMGAEVQVHSAGFADGQLQVTLRDIPKAKQGQITRAMKTLDRAEKVYTPYREVIFLVTLPAETVEAEELLGKPQYIPERPVKGEAGKQRELVPPAPPAIEDKGEALTAEEETGTGTATGEEVEAPETEEEEHPKPEKELTFLYPCKTCSELVNWADERLDEYITFSHIGDGVECPHCGLEAIHWKDDLPSHIWDRLQTAKREKEKKDGWGFPTLWEEEEDKE